MKIGNLFDNRSDKNVKYSYRARGLETLKHPDVAKEEVVRDYYTKDNGNLFFDKEISWNDSVLLYDGIDIEVELGENCFIDHFEIKHGKGAAVASYEVFDGDMNKIGSCLPESGKTVSGEDITIPVGYYTDKLTLRINGCCMPVIIENLHIWGAWELENSVWPIPEKENIKSETYPLSSLKSIKAITEDEIFVAEYFNEKLSEKEGITLEIVKENGDLEINTTEGCEKDGYELSSENGKVIVSAKNRLNLLYGADALLQLIKDGKVKNATIDHKAFKELRGVHFALPRRNKIEFLKNMVKYVFVPMQYNTIYLQISGAMRYDNFPEINTAWAKANEDFENGKGPAPAHYGFVGKDILEKSEVRELCDYFESFGLEVVPEVQSWAHVQYLTYAYPELCEYVVPKKEDTIDLNEKDIMPEPTTHCMCPSHPDYYKYTFGVLDEVLEVVKPKRFVHMGHDEIIVVGGCSECQKKERGDIFAEEVNALHAYLKEKGLRMVIWADMIQNMYYSTPTAINKIPKDILMADFVWYFFLDKDIEDNLLEHGFEVIMGNYYTSHYPRFEERIRKEGMLGGEVSTWVECSEFSYAFEGKMYDFVMSSTSLVNSAYREDLRLTYNELVKPVLKDIRENIGGLKCKGEEKPVSFEGCRKNIPFDIRDLVCYDKAIALNKKTSEVEVVVDANAEIISFVHATDIAGNRAPWKPAFKVADYEIIYEDGSSYTEGIFYAANIHKYKSTYGDRLTSPFYRHEGYAGTYLSIPECGKTYNGEDYTLGKYSIKNPSPEKKIKSVKLKYNNETYVSVLVFNISIK